MDTESTSKLPGIHSDLQIHQSSLSGISVKSWHRCIASRKISWTLLSGVSFIPRPGSVSRATRIFHDPPVLHSRSILVVIFSTCVTSYRTCFFHALCGIGYADKMAIGQLNRFVHILFKSGFFNSFTFSRFFWSSVYIGQYRPLWAITVYHSIT